MRRRFCLVMLVLWLIVVCGVVWVFVRGWTTPGADGRTEIIVAPIERDQILGEMRQLLKAVHGVIAGLQTGDQKGAADAARSVGMQAAADVSPAIMIKLPLAFKQMGMSVHRDFDGLADGIARGEPSAQALGRLSSITSRCTTCHDLYRLSSK
jgi:hypothetical protein